MTRPARVIVDPAALRANLEVVRRCAPGRRVMAIIKADAYGHGLGRIARVIDDVDAFGVASIEEAVTLRDAGIDVPIVLLEGPFEAIETREFVPLRLQTVIHNIEQVRMVAGIEDQVPVWIKIDTGMHRLGFSPETVAELTGALGRPDRTIRYMTHFANAHHRGDESVMAQRQAFEDAVANVEGERCLANSSAILAWPDTHADWVRPGLMLYGISPFPGESGSAHGLQPVMTLASALIAVKRVPRDGTVGYGRGYRCPEDMTVGVVALGYGDGYPRQAGTGTPILVNGVRTQVIGEASMDMLTVDLREVPNPRVGDPVTLWGDGLPVEEVASHAGTIAYELLCRVNMRARYVEKVR